MKATTAKVTLTASQLYCEARHQMMRANNAYGAAALRVERLKKSLAIAEDRLYRADVAFAAARAAARAADANERAEAAERGAALP